MSQIDIFRHYTAINIYAFIFATIVPKVSITYEYPIMYLPSKFHKKLPTQF